MTMLGASIEDLTSFAATLTSNAGKIEAAAQQLSGQLNTAWTGPDGDEFRSLWRQELQPSLTRAAMTLSEASQRIRAQAREQEQTSNTDGASGGVGGLGSGLSTEALLALGAEQGSSAVSSVLGPILALPWAEADSLVSRMDLVVGLSASLAGFLSGESQLAKSIPKLFAEGSKMAKLFPAVLGEGSTATKFMSSSSKVLGTFGNVLSGIGVVTGTVSTVKNLAEGNYYAAADSGIGLALAAGTFLPPPAGPISAGLGLTWSVAQIVSGDVPVTKRIVDGAQWVGDRANDAGKALGDAGKALGDAANETGKFASNVWNSFWGK